MENGVDSVGRPLAEEETLTADGGISQLKLVDNVVQVFHERNVSEGDDVFEEAIDGNPEETPHAEEHQIKTDLDEAIVNGDEIVEKKSDLNLLEVNGSPNGDHTSEMFEEAIVELVSSSLDTSSEVGQSIVDDDKMQPLVVPDSVGEVTAKELVAAEVRVEDSEKDFEVAESVAEVRVAEPVAEVRVAEPVTDVHDAGVVDEHIYQKDILPEEQIDSLTSNVEEEVKEVAEVIENGETKAFNDVREDTNGSYDVSTHETSEAIDVDEVKHGEKSTAPGVADLSPGNETSEQIICEDDQNWESKDTVACEDTSANEEEVSETKNISTNLTSSVNEKTWDEGVINPVPVEAIPTDIDQSVDAKVESDSEDVQDHSSGTHSVDQNDEVVGHISSVVQADEPERQTEEEKQDSVINDLGVTSMTRETESPVLIEDVLEKQIEQEKQDSLINNLGVTSLTRETESPVLVEDIQENETESEQEEQRRLIEGFTTKEMESLVRALEERETRNEQEKHDPEIAEVGESVDKETTQSVVEGPPKIHERETKQEKRITEVERESQPAVDPSPPPSRPAGLGGAAPLLEPTRVAQQSRVNGALPQRQTQIVEDTTNGETEENDETREKLQMIRVKFLRLARRLGQTPHNVVVAQVLYRLGLAEQLRGRNAGRVGGFSFDRASAMAEQLEAAGQEPLDFSCTIMVLGKTGVGKSATINSIFDEVKFSTDAFQMGTNKVQDVVGTVQGIKVRVIDTPGLLPCWSDQRQNEKILHSVKRFIKKNPPDIVLYLDRLDMQSRDFGDMPLLRTITDIFGPSIWFNAIVVLTHAASAPPDGPNGTASSYEMFVTQRSHVVQQAIRQAAGDMRLMNPVSLVENHSACRTNRAGQRVLPNGQVWKPHLLLLSFASKILAEANTLLKLQDNPPGKPFATRSRVPPLPFLLSSLLQSRPQVKLPEEQYGDEDGMDEELDDSSDSDDESEYDELPPFKSLTKVQLAKLDKAQKKAYFDELEYREKLFMKKQLKDEKKRRKLLKKMEASAKDLPNDYNENADEDSGAAASVPVAMPDFALPTSFDSDNPTHRYRFLDTSNQWLVRPVLETHGWDHDVGYEGINVERLFVIKEKIPLSFSGQVTKDKKESNLQMELAGSVKHGEGKATSLGFDMQTIGKDMAYTLRSDTRFSNYRHNQSAAGLSVTLLGDALTAGVKLEDRLIVNKRFRLVMTGGAMTGRGDVAYGGSLEATLRDKDHPLGRTLSTLGLSVMDWHGDLAIGCNIQSQIPVGRTTNLIARANLNNRGTGQVSIRLNSSEQLQIALIGLLPLIRKVVGHYQQMVNGKE